MFRTFALICRDIQGKPKKLLCKNRGMYLPLTVCKSIQFSLLGGMLNDTVWSGSCLCINWPAQGRFIKRILNALEATPQGSSHLYRCFYPYDCTNRVRLPVVSSNEFAYNERRSLKDRHELKDKGEPKHCLGGWFPPKRFRPHPPLETACLRCDWKSG